MNTTFSLDNAILIEDSIYKTGIEGLLYIDRKLLGDDRGFFSEVAHVPSIQKVTGTDFSIKQINHARSEKNVVRGIHAEDWNKCIFLASGKAFCAVVDLRTESPTFKKVETFILGFDEESLHGGLFVPKGLGNSVVVLEGPLDYIYFVDKLYSERDPLGDVAVSLFDPELAIEWPIPREDMIISERDKNAVTVKEKFGAV
ncbi:dTDP-4-dehydrorhamnose 3,5-epimerase family protein [Candidatus Roizmanbacteria bacterium]|nr:MAG: dTDP-4-dehydrorhamnose 3,5-epimerase family protein [Candidatus Roizmanbacteria bacterium]